ncbi:hypothetical protein ACE6H2_009340 [Prunus campanulata]
MFCNDRSPQLFLFHPFLIDLLFNFFDLKAYWIVLYLVLVSLGVFDFSIVNGSSFRSRDF